MSIKDKFENNADTKEASKEEPRPNRLSVWKPMEVFYKAKERIEAGQCTYKDLRQHKNPDITEEEARKEFNSMLLASHQIAATKLHGDCLKHQNDGSLLTRNNVDAFMDHLRAATELYVLNLAAEDKNPPPIEDMKEIITEAKAQTANEYIDLYNAIHLAGARRAYALAQENQGKQPSLAISQLKSSRDSLKKAEAGFKDLNPQGTETDEQAQEAFTALYARIEASIILENTPTSTMN